MHLDDHRIKVSVIGLGHVGTALTQLLLGCRDHAFQLNLVDPSPDVEGSFLDLAHAAAVLGRHSIARNDPALLARSRFIFHAAGENSSPGASRNSVMAANIRLTRQIFGSTDFRPDARIIVVTNPVDIISYHAWKSSGLPAAQVIGTGTLLDSHRLQWILHQRKDVPLEAVKALVLGEHGATMTPIYSQTSFGSVSGNCIGAEEQADLTAELRGSATRIRQTAEATKWAPAASAYELMRAFLDPPPQHLAASVLLDEGLRGRLGVGEMYFGMPARFDENGCHCDLNVEMAETEWEALRGSALVVQGLLGGK